MSQIVLWGPKCEWYRLFIPDQWNDEIAKGVAQITHSEEVAAQFVVTSPKSFWCMVKTLENCIIRISWPNDAALTYQE